jgi:hypothetical protein
MAGSPTRADAEEDVARGREPRGCLGRSDMTLHRQQSPHH